MTSDHLLTETRDGVAILTFNRPERLNALSADMIQNAIAALERYSTDPAIGCIVVTGAGRGFCAGGDVAAMNAGTAGTLTFEQRVDRQRAFRDNSRDAVSTALRIRSESQPCNRRTQGR
jgi:enoyl-CoA hydratase/carnithine racemase